MPLHRTLYTTKTEQTIFLSPGNGNLIKVAENGTQRTLKAGEKIAIIDSEWKFNRLLA